MHTILLGSERSPAYIQQLSTAGLGDHSYLVIAGEEAVLIDPQRDTDRFDEQILAAGARLVAVMETHVHNDYLTGGAALAAAAGAEYVVPIDSELSIPHHAIAEGDEVAVGDWCLTALHTPGHTNQHFSYRLASRDGDEAVFTGGSMLVGAVGRSDLVSPALTEPLARLQYNSVRRIADVLPDPAWVAPTHGAGSFCAASNVLDTVSTIARERDRNPALLARDEETFLREQLASLRLYPTYYQHMAGLNRVGPKAVSLRPVPYLSPDQVRELSPETWIIDMRRAGDFAANHIPGSINIPGGNDTATYIGWVIPWGSPIVLVTEGAHELEHLRLSLARIGIENVIGAVVDGLAAWRGNHYPIDSYPVATFADLHRDQPEAILDVRDPVEYADAALPNARNLHVSRILENEADVPAGKVWVHCASGYRAAIGASMIERFGREPVLVNDSFSRANA